MDSSDIVLITGATGFVGSAVARAVQATGARVRALVRPSSTRTNLAGLDVEFVSGDVRDEAAVAAAMHGVRYAFHVAADYRLWARDPQEIVRTNVEGTRRIMVLARAVNDRVFSKEILDAVEASIRS